MLIVFALVLAWADKRVSTRTAEMGEHPFGPRDAAIMGLAQAVALQPGVSRSGVTITAGRMLGFDRESAARLSFLMAMPVIAGAGAVKGLKVVADGGLGPGLAAPFFWGMVASALTGAIRGVGVTAFGADPRVRAVRDLSHRRRPSDHRHLLRSLNRGRAAPA